MSDDLFCETCKVPVRRRDLHTKYVETGECRQCGTVLDHREGHDMTDSDHQAANDLAALGEWLESVCAEYGYTAVARHEEENAGWFCWVIEGAGEPWVCECVYRKGARAPYLNLVSDRWAIDVPADAVHAGIETHATEADLLCASHGVYRTHERFSCSRWGVAYPLFLGRIIPEYFHPIVDRLAVVMHELSGRFGNRVEAGEVPGSH